jgi:hypothetical protein
MDNEPAGRLVLADAAYGSGETRVALKKRRHRLAIKPWPMADTGRFGRDHFSVDHAARTATCPAGVTVSITAKGTATFGVRCNGCSLRSRCTTRHDGRTLILSLHDAELVEARRAWRDGDFADDYRQHAAWPGSSDPVDASPIAVSPTTESGSPTAPPPSICDASSPWASPTTEAGNSPPDPSRPDSRQTRNTPSPTCHPPQPALTLNTSASLSQNPDPPRDAHPLRAETATCSALS